MSAFTETHGKVPADMLELGSGGGNVASHLARYTRLTLVDPAPDMLAVSRQLNPNAEHVEGDRRHIRLGKTFDAVLIHDAIMYLTSEDDLVSALATARAHLESNGVLIVLPDYVTLQPGIETGGRDASDGTARGVRWISWDACSRNRCYNLRRRLRDHGARG